MSTLQDPPSIQFTPELCERLINMEEGIELSNVSPSLEGIPVPTRPYDYASGFEDGQSETGLAAELAEDTRFHELHNLAEAMAAALVESKKLLEFLPTEYVHKDSLKPIKYSPDGALNLTNTALTRYYESYPKL